MNISVFLDMYLPISRFILLPTVEETKQILSFIQQVTCLSHWVSKENNLDGLEISWDSWWIA